MPGIPKSLGNVSWDYYYCLLQWEGRTRQVILRDLSNYEDSMPHEKGNWVGALLGRGGRVLGDRE